MERPVEDQNDSDENENGVARGEEADDGSTSQSDDEVYQCPKSGKVQHRDATRYGERGQGKSKFLIFSPSNNHENSRGRGRPMNRGRGNRSLHSAGANEERDGDSNPLYRKNLRGKMYDKAGDSTDNHAGQEEGRIGRQLRLLSRELNEDNIIKICQQLQESFVAHDNFRYIRYNLMTIGSSLMEAFKLANSNQTRSVIAMTLARLGYVSDHEFHNFVKWILGSYHKERTEKICCSIMDSLMEMLKMDEQNPRLKNVGMHLLPGLQSALESADSPALFESTLKPVLILAVRYPAAFLPHFRDTVDILVGWFIDPSQPANVAVSAGRALRGLRPFWGDDLPFSLTLLTQFLEDLDAYATEANSLMTAPPSGEENPRDSLRKIASLLSVFHVVGNEVCSFPEAGAVFSPTFLNLSLSKIGVCLNDLLDASMVDGQVAEALQNLMSDVVKAANQCVRLLVDWLGPAVSSVSLQPALDLLGRQVHAAPHYQYPVLLTVLQLMTCLVSVAPSEIRIDTLQLWMQFAHWLMRSGQPAVLQHVSRLLRAMIRVKNVPLLIEVYRRLAADLDECFASLKRQTKAGHLVTESEESAIVLLSPLAELGRSGSFVGMWALDPGLLELLSSKIQPVGNLRLILDSHPALLLGLLRVLHSHAKSHNHFVANSSLVSAASGALKSLQFDSRSPTSGNLSVILQLLTDLCDQLERRNDHSAVKRLLLQWSAQLLTTCKPCTSQLNSADLFQRFLAAAVRLCRSEYSASAQVTQGVGSLLDSVLDLPELTLKTELAVDVATAAIQQLRAQASCSDRWVHLLGRCPPQIALEAARRVRASLYASTTLGSWVHNEEAIPARNFQLFFDHLLQNAPLASVESLFWFHAGGAKMSAHAPAAVDVPQWLAAQCALYCVNNKLRTTLGKPQETFLTIEEAIKKAARGGAKEEVMEQNIVQLTRVQLLLSFYEYLEKFMFNAYDGSSNALPAAPKAIRVFFRTNQTTCQEWVNRLCGAAMSASVKAGRYASAVRYGLNTLSHWANQQRRLDAADVEMVLEQLVCALIKLRASQSIRGLRKWIASQPQLSKLIDAQFLEATALQAEWKFEEAAERYAAVLDGVNGPKLKQFVCDRAVESYVALSDWDGLQKWKSSVGDWSGQCGRQTAELLEHFDSNVHLHWPESASDVQWSADSLIDEVKSSLLLAADRIRSSRSIYSTPEMAWKIIEFFGRASVSLPHLPGDCGDSLACWLPLAHAMSDKNDSAYQWMEHLHSGLAGCSSTSLDFAHSSAAIEWSRWLHWYLSLDEHAAAVASTASRTDLLTVSLACEEGNLRLAERQLSKRLAPSPGCDLPTQLMNEVLKIQFRTPEASLAIQTQFQGAKLLYLKGEKEAAVNVLTQCSLALCRSLRSPLPEADDPLLPHMAESYLLLGKWLHQNPNPFRNFDSLRELAGVDYEDRSLDLNASALVSRLMERAAQICPSAAHGWLAWGRFQYAEAQDRTRYSQFIPEMLADVMEPEDLQRLLGSIDELKANAEQVMASSTVLNKKPALLKRILAEVHLRQTQAIDSYCSAVRSFFTYLQVDGRNASTATADAVDVTLRILRILTRNLCADDVELQQVLEKGIEQTPSSAWRSLTPQLFSLLQRGKPWLRSAVSKLLGRLAVRWPHLLVFPAAVGEAGLAWSWSSDADDDADEDAEGEAATDRDASVCSASELQSNYADLMSTLSREAANMVRDVRLLLQELRRLVLLWDELWVATLQQVHPLVEQLFNKLLTQIQKLQKKGSLTEEDKKQLLQENFQVLFKPIILTLEAVASVTNGTPQTPHEQLFHHRYGRVINDGIAALQDIANAERPQDLWLPFKNMFQQLQHISHRRSVLKLDEASPLLKSLRDTFIPMPGVGGDKREMSLTVRSIDNVAMVLPTKTKPKKLMFIGSDGKRYAYLFKGMEDMHLDERIMQILSVANVLLSSDRSSGSKGYRARHYGVIPMGPRSGLIQWVEGVTPLFAIYKRWLQRQTAHSATQGRGDKDNPTMAVPRPSELFYNKLTPKLDALGLSSDPRQRAQWPLETLRQVLAELMEETPKDLLARELWLGSLNAEQWWESTQRLGRSCAVMSVIGYVIGLGDRHLDNVLVDLRCGEVVHIDYNVCFEKGRQLRVPENVPFRLTANIQHALGPAGTGLQGTFRYSCVDVMKMLRQNCQLFQILMEHFVYDPLIDWRPQFGTNESTLVPLFVVNPSLAAQCFKQKRALGTDAVFEMFKLRTSELGPDWSDNKAEMVAIVKGLREAADAWVDVHNRIQRLQEEVQDLHEDRLALFEIRSNGNHLMRQPQQLEKILLPLRAAWDGEQTVRLALGEMLADHLKWIQFYEMAFNSLKSGQLKQWAELLNTSPESGQTGFLLVEEFLNSSGQIGLALQGQALEQQVRSLMVEQQATASLVVALLGRYAAIAALYPPSKLELHRTSLIGSWIRQLEANPTSQVCKQLAEMFQDHISLESTVHSVRMQRIAAFKAEVLRLLSDVSQALESPSMQMSDADLNDADTELMDSKEVVEQFIILHGYRPVNYAVAHSLRRAYHQVQTIRSNESSPVKSTAVTGLHSTVNTMALLSGTISLATEILNGNENMDAQVKETLGLLQSLHQLYQDIQEFVFNGTTIVLPEMIRLFESSDDSVLHVYRELEALCVNINLSKMEMTSLRFQDLLSEAGTNDGQAKSMAPGHMLLLCLNGLFDKMESGLLDLMQTLGKCHINGFTESYAEPYQQAWVTVNSQLYNRLEDALLAKRLLLMLSLFQSCANWTELFRAASDARSDLFQNKFQKMATSWEKQFLRGFLSLCVVHLTGLLVPGGLINTCSSLDELMSRDKSGADDPVAQQGIELIGTVENNWQKCELMKMSRQLMDMERSLLQVLQQQLSAHSWIHDTDAGMHSASAAFILELRQALSFLLPQSTQLAEIIQPVISLASQIEQRLKWAAGANPSLHQVLKDFTAVQEKCLSYLETCSSMATSLGAIGSAVLHYENFRSRTQDALDMDTAYFQLLSRYQHICLVKECASNSQLSDTEIRLVKRIAPEKLATSDWIDEAEKSLTETILSNKNRTVELQVQQVAHADALRSGNAELRSKLTAHHQLISDVRSVLKGMAKCELENGPVSRYLEQYRQFSELCSSVSRHLAAKEYDASKLAEIQVEAHQLDALIDPIYDGFQQLNEASRKAERRPAPKETPEVNAIAASIWHRVRLKLDGRDPQPHQQLTVDEQVDAIIDEATNLDNLALLYEGWTPWV